MKTTVYAGEHWFWNLRQVAYAAKRIRNIPPTLDGLAMLQTAWLNSKQPNPPRDSWDGDVAWAQAAFRDIDARDIKYEEVI